MTELSRCYRAALHALRASRTHPAETLRAE